MNETNSTAPAGLGDEFSRDKNQGLFAEQVEFEFAAAVTTAPQKKRRRRTAPSGVKSGADESNACVEERGGYRKDALKGDSKTEAFGDDWIDEVRNSITNSRDLREAVTLSACYLAELIDLEVETRGYCDEWNQAYSAYCATQLFSFTPEEDEKTGTPRLAWAFAALIFYAYEYSNELTDWHLFEELCCGELAPEDSDQESAEAYTIRLFSSCLRAIHDIICNGGAKVFSAKYSYSAE
ncbi:MAG: hypothetical protein WCK17_07685 [Verrucomicrobiota bacterium]